MVYRKGLRAGSRSFVLFGMPTSHGQSRLGLTVTRKVGSAVVRNRLKRRFRESFRRNRAGFVPAMDLVVNAFPSSIERSAHELEQELTRAFIRLAAEVDR